MSRSQQRGVSSSPKEQAATTAAAPAGSFDLAEALARPRQTLAALMDAGMPDPDLAVQIVQNMGAPGRDWLLDDPSRYETLCDQLGEYYAGLVSRSLAPDAPGLVDRIPAEVTGDKLAQDGLVQAWLVGRAALLGDGLGGLVEDMGASIAASPGGQISHVPDAKGETDLLTFDTELPGPNPVHLELAEPAVMIERQDAGPAEEGSLTTTRTVDGHVTAQVIATFEGTNSRLRMLAEDRHVSVSYTGNDRLGLYRAQADAPSLDLDGFEKER